eukprot:1576491-Pyramimonas_sp.AAC.1
MPHCSNQAKRGAGCQQGRAPACGDDLGSVGAINTQPGGPRKARGTTPWACARENNTDGERPHMKAKPIDIAI